MVSGEAVRALQHIKCRRTKDLRERPVGAPVDHHGTQAVLMIIMIVRDKNGEVFLINALRIDYAGLRIDHADLRMDYADVHEMISQVRVVALVAAIHEERVLHGSVQLDGFTQLLLGGPLIERQRPRHVIDPLDVLAIALRQARARDSEIVWRALCLRGGETPDRGENVLTERFEIAMQNEGAVALPDIHLVDFQAGANGRHAASLSLDRRLWPHSMHRRTSTPRPHQVRP